MEFWNVLWPRTQKLYHSFTLNSNWGASSGLELNPACQSLRNHFNISLCGQSCSILHQWCDVPEWNCWIIKQKSNRILESQKQMWTGRSWVLVTMATGSGILLNSSKNLRINLFPFALSCFNKIFSHWNFNVFFPKLLHYLILFLFLYPR